MNSPDTGTTTNTYHAAGNLKTRTDAKGLTTYTYDALNRLTGVAYGDGGTAAYTYDTGTNGIGRVTALDDASGHTQWSYDQHGRVTQNQATVGSVTLTTQYSYDAYGRLSAMVYPSGATVGYTYANGQVSAISLNGQPLLSGIQYQPFGAVNAWIWGNGTADTRQFDQDGRMTSLTLAADTRTLGYDAASRLTSLTDTQTTMSFGYDAIDRLIQVTGGPVDQAFQYDPNGNRTTLTEGAAVTTYTYLSGTNRLGSYDGTAPRTYGYDANGSPTGDGVHTYTYDARNRLVAVDGGTTATYTLNDLGQRVEKLASINPLPGDANGDGMINATDFSLAVSVILQQASASGSADCNRDNQVNVQDLVCMNSAIAGGGSPTGIATYFAYDEQGKLIGEYDGQGNPIEETVYFQGMPVATVQSGTAYYVYSDHLGTPRVITDTSNTVLWRWDSTAFGETAPNEDPDGDGSAFTYNLRFPGQYYDGETGIYYNYFRDYDPGTGRYVESDPIGLTAGPNAYTYVLNDPTSHIDPYGLWEWPSPPQWLVNASAALGDNLLFGQGQRLRNLLGISGGVSHCSPSYRVGTAIGVIASLADGEGEIPLAKWTFSAFKSEAKWLRQLEKRGWTPELITEAIQKGESFPAKNMVNPSNAAARYVSPSTGQSVVVDTVTKEVLHVGGPGFKY